MPAKFDEIVIFQENHILPFAIVTLKEKIVEPILPDRVVKELEELRASLREEQEKCKVLSIFFSFFHILLPSRRGHRDVCGRGGVIGRRSGEERAGITGGGRKIVSISSYISSANIL